MKDSHRRLHDKRHVCCSACGKLTPADKALVQVQEAMFCEDCWHNLSMSELESVARELALRGVPLS